MNRNEQPELLAKNIAANLSALRRENGMTQAALAERIGYSDKSISKWERGEGMPDVLCLKVLADLFGVTVDYFLEAEHDPESQPGTPELSETAPVKTVRYEVNRMNIVWITLAGIGMIALLLYLILRLCGIPTLLPFVTALPVIGVVSVVFAGLWGSRLTRFFTVTLLCWTVLFFLCYLLRGYGAWLLMTLGIPATGIAALAFRVRKKADSGESGDGGASDRDE